MLGVSPGVLLCLGESEGPKGVGTIPGLYDSAGVSYTLISFAYLFC